MFFSQHFKNEFVSGSQEIVYFLVIFTNTNIKVFFSKCVFEKLHHKNIKSGNIFKKMTYYLCYNLCVPVPKRYNVKRFKHDRLKNISKNISDKYCAVDKLFFSEIKSLSVALKIIVFTINKLNWFTSIEFNGSVQTPKSPHPTHYTWWRC